MHVPLFNNPNSTSYLILYSIFHTSFSHTTHTFINLISDEHNEHTNSLYSLYLYISTSPLERRILHN